MIVSLLFINYRDIYFLEERKEYMLNKFSGQKWVVLPIITFLVVVFIKKSSFTIN